MRQKKALLVIVSFLISCFVNAQLEESESADWTVVGRLKFGGITKAKLQYIANGSDTAYMLFIRDVRDQPTSHYFSVSFKNIDGTYEKLYSILKSFFLAENRKNNGYSRTFKLGDASVRIQHHLLITGKGIMFSTNDGYTYWSEKDIDKLFGRR